jgi:hypothetical protein
VALSTCGDTRSTGACSSNGARCISAYVVTIPRSAISHDRTFCGSAPSSGVNVVMAVGSPTGSTTRQPATSASAVRVAWPSSASRARIRSGPAARCSPSDRIPHARSDIGVAVLQPLQHGQRQIPVRRRQPRSQPLRQRGPDREDTDAARARALPADGDGRLVVDEAAAVLSADPPALVHLTALAS